MSKVWCGANRFSSAQDGKVKIETKTNRFQCARFFAQELFNAANVGDQFVGGRVKPRRRGTCTVCCRGGAQHPDQAGPNERLQIAGITTEDVWNYLQDITAVFASAGGRSCVGTENVARKAFQVTGLIGNRDSGTGFRLAINDLKIDLFQLPLFALLWPTIHHGRTANIQIDHNAGPFTAP